MSRLGEDATSCRQAPIDQIDGRGTAVQLVRTPRRRHWYRRAQLSSLILEPERMSPSHRCWPVPDPRVTIRP